MNKFNMWLQRLMWGRYGNDNLNKAMLVAGFVLIILNMFINLRIFHWLVVVLLILVYSRMFSRNHNARAMENRRYLEFISKFKKNGTNGYGSSYGNSYSRTGGNTYGSYSSGTSYRGSANTYTSAPKKDKTHKILRCPSCNEKLRVPKGVGKINITCPHCNLKFIKKV